MAPLPSHVTQRAPRDQAPRRPASSSAVTVPTCPGNVLARSRVAESRPAVAVVARAPAALPRGEIRSGVLKAYDLAVLTGRQAEPAPGHAFVSHAQARSHPLRGGVVHVGN